MWSWLSRRSFAVAQHCSSLQRPQDSSGKSEDQSKKVAAEAAVPSKTDAEDTDTIMQTDVAAVRKNSTDNEEDDEERPLSELQAPPPTSASKAILVQPVPAPAADGATSDKAIVSVASPAKVAEPPANDIPMLAPAPAPSTPCASACSTPGLSAPSRASPPSSKQAALQVPRVASAAARTGATAHADAAAQQVVPRIANPLARTGTTAHRDVQQLLNTPARPGGLLDAIRARGILQGTPSTTAASMPAPATPVVASLASGAAIAGAPAADAHGPLAPLQNGEVVHRAASSGPLATSAPRSPVVEVQPMKAEVLRTPSKPANRRRPRPPPVPVFKPSPDELQHRQNEEFCRLLRQVRLGEPKRPEDNYEISDKEDSSDEFGDLEFEPDRSRKHVPAWCNNYLDALAGQEAVDPDSVFGVNVPNCDLDAIFPDNLYRAFNKAKPKRRRGSSCMWNKDRLRRSEVVMYRQKMGQTRRWSALKIRRSVAKALAPACRSVRAVGVNSADAKKALRAVACVG